MNKGNLVKLSKEWDAVVGQAYIETELYLHERFKKNDYVTKSDIKSVITWLFHEHSFGQRRNRAKALKSLKTVKNEYTKFFPSFSTQFFENKLLESLRSTLWRLSHDTMFPNKESLNNFKNCILDNIEGRIRRAEPYVKAYQIITEIHKYSSGHYEVPCIMGFFCELKREYERALSYYEQSLHIIESDPIIDTSKGFWKINKEEIQEHIERTKKKMVCITS